MADQAVVHIGENSPEEVAYKLFQDICRVEKRDLYSHGSNVPDKHWILTTYVECIKAVRLGVGPK